LAAAHSHHLKLRKNAHCNPTVKFLKIEWLLLPINDSEGREEAGERMNYDKSGDEEDLYLKQEGFSHPLSAVLPVDQDEDNGALSDASGPVSEYCSFFLPKKDTCMATEPGLPCF
jgi:hypothetical protein